MSEKKLSLPEIFLIVFDFIIVGAVVVFLVLLTLSYERDVKSNDMARASVELADNLVSSRLTTDRIIFSKDELDRIDGTDAEPVRNCQYAYHAKITAFEKISGKDRWEFGYETNQYAGLNRIEDTGGEFPVSIKADKLYPGKMEITVYNTYLGMVECLIENAFASKETKKIPVLCPSTKSSRFCDLSIDQQGTKICYVTDTKVSGSPEAECREFPAIQYKGIVYSFEKKNLEKMSLVAMPLKSPPASTSISCKDMEPNKAGKTDPIATVALCLEET